MNNTGFPQPVGNPVVRARANGKMPDCIATRSRHALRPTLVFVLPAHALGNGQMGHRCAGFSASPGARAWSYQPMRHESMTFVSNRFKCTEHPGFFSLYFPANPSDGASRKRRIPEVCVAPFDSAGNRTKQALRPRSSCWLCLSRVADRATFPRRRREDNVAFVRRACRGSAGGKLVSDGTGC
jgi:hypothetical protein